ncbi:UNVERIFIED_ORG: hypothetical protein ABID33_003562 [Xanthobacter viscosus]
MILGALRPWHLDGATLTRRILRLCADMGALAAIKGA